MVVIPEVFPTEYTKHAKNLLDQSSAPSIVNVSSMRGLAGCGGTDVIDYSASKAALINLTQTLSKEFKKITVNTIAPGFVATENSKELPKTLKSAAINNSSIQRFVEMNEVADLCYFLTSSLARAITGTVIPIDGGYSMIRP
jgi:3-oxoacyl-[acyl-carrier protein] reductase